MRIEKSPYGFMSNINDILLDTFFLEAPYGAWAENYVNKLLEKISQLGQEIKGNANTIPKKKTTEEFMKRIECLEKENRRGTDSQQSSEKVTPILLSDTKPKDAKKSGGRNTAGRNPVFKRTPCQTGTG